MPRNHEQRIKVFETAKIIGRENIEFGNYVIIDDFVFISAKKKMKLGNYVHIASHSSVTGIDVFEMGDFSGLSQGVRVFTGSEDFTDWGFGNPTIAAEFRNITVAPVRIQPFASVGANSVVLPGVTIGEGATVGANSVVTRDLEPWGVYVGNRMIRRRDKDRVLRTHDAFLAADEHTRVGNLFT